MAAVVQRKTFKKGAGLAAPSNAAGWEYSQFGPIKWFFFKGGTAGSGPSNSIIGTSADKATNMSNYLDYVCVGSNVWSTAQ